MSTLRLTNLQHTDASDPNIVLANNRTVALADGTASAPALSFQDDLDTGLYSPGANSIALGVGGSAILTIASTGNTTFTGAITTTSLSAQSTSTSSWFQTGTVLGGIDYVWATKDTSGNVWHSGLQTDGDLYLGGNLVGTTNIKLNGSDGSATFANNVGIGTSNPEEILHVAAASEAVNTRDGVMLQSTSALAADTGLPLVFTSHIGNVANYGIASIAGRKENATSGNAAGYLQFATGSSAGAVSEKVRIDSDGNVGINRSSSLGAKLHIQDDSATDTTQIKLRNYKSSVNTKAALMFELSTASGQGGTAVIKGVCGTDAGGTNIQNDGGLEFQTSSGGSGTLGTALLINKDKTLQLPSNSPGIGFGSSTAADLLDDYEEGTFDAGFDSNAPTNVNYTRQAGFYVKVGKLVQCVGTFTFTTYTTFPTGYSSFTLPFTPESLDGEGDAFSQSWWACLGGGQVRQTVSGANCFLFGPLGQSGFSNIFTDGVGAGLANANFNTIFNGNQAAKTFRYHHIYRAA
jgi:hypothetical protein